MKGKKTGGRKKGTPNNTTDTQRKAAEKLISTMENNGELDSAWKLLTPKEKWDVYIRMKTLVTPRPTEPQDINVHSTNAIVDAALAALAAQNDNV